MPFYAAPGVAQLKVYGTIDAVPWNSLIYFQQPAGAVWTSGQLSSAGDAIMGGMAATINSANFYTGLTWSGVTGVDLGVVAPAVGSSTHAPVSGASPNEMTGANCIMINYTIPLRYRGGKPRTYLPGMISIQQSNSNQWAATTFNTFVSAWTTSLNQVNTAVVGAGATSCVQCVPTWTYTYTDDPVKHKYEKHRSGFKASYPVTAVHATRTIRTQRRRLGGH